MKKIEIKGGLGNQLFQYAYARKLNIINKNDICLDLSFFKIQEGSGATKRDYKLDKFNIFNLKTIQHDKDNDFKFQYIINKIIYKLGIEKEQYFQSESYFKEIEHVIRKEITPIRPLSESAQYYVNIIEKEIHPISIHIRRGDYADNKKTNSIHGLCNIDYYNKAIKYMNKIFVNSMFFVFSDDINWAKDNLVIENSIFVSDNQIEDYEELILMSKCQHNIIANSTFSWWGAWLNSNPNKIVIAPKQWTTQKTSNQMKILPDGWLQF